MKKLKKHLSKRQYIIFILSLIIVLLLTFSYAFYLNTDNTLENITTTECFKLTLNDNNDINLDKTYPISDEEGSLLTPYTFTIRNICNAIEEYQINIETINTSTISTNNIRYKLDNGLSQKLGEQEEVLEYVNENIKESRKIEIGELQKNEERTYNLRLWIDEESTTEETSNKIYASKVVIKTVPSVDITLNTFGGTISQNTIRKVVGRPIGQIEEPVRAGYQFLRWYYDSEFTREVNEEDIVESKTKNLYAKYLANTDTRYTVEHYQMDTNGNYPTSPTTTEVLTGTTDTLVTPEVNTYTGFKTPSAEVVNIDGDGSRVVKYYYERNKYTQTTQGRYMNTSGAYGSYSTLETKDVYYGASYSYSKTATVEYNAASVAAYTVTGTKTNSLDFSRRQYTQTTQGRYMNTSGAYGSYSTLETKNVYYGATYSYSKAATAEYNAASVTAYTVTAAKTNQISFSRRQYTQTTQGRYMNTAGNYGSYSNLESKNVYYGASYSYSKAATAEYNAASVAAYTVTAAKTNQISFSRRQYTLTFNANGGSVSPTSRNVYYNASTTLPTPTRSGYTHNGWYTATSGGSKYGNAGASYTVTAAKTMYAQWTRNAIDVQYDGKNWGWNISGFNYRCWDNSSCSTSYQLSADTINGTSHSAITTTTYSTVDFSALRIVAWYGGGVNYPTATVRLYLCSTTTSCSQVLSKSYKMAEGDNWIDTNGNITSYNGNYYIKVTIDYNNNNWGLINISNIILTN